ncbi:MAG: F0F1 ATP synthase subunit epsilon [Candidatus Latescibacteria bacterium]|nr:F0F1 ATP synthase subunit epsilon [Candidatus Latescibacterota bacterium]
MAENTFHVEVITPEKVLISDEVNSVEVPGAHGEFQILTGHTPFLTSLKIGLLTVTKGVEKILISISGGYCEVMPEKTTILAHTAETAKQIDKARAEAARKRAQSRIDNAEKDSSIDIDRAQLALLRAINRIKTKNMK